MLVSSAGFEPATLRVEVPCSIQLSYEDVVRAIRFELIQPVWKTGTLPLRHARCSLFLSSDRKKKEREMVGSGREIRTPNLQLTKPLHYRCAIPEFLRPVYP